MHFELTAQIVARGSEVMDGGTIALISKSSAVMGGRGGREERSFQRFWGPNKVHCVASGHPSAPL